MLPPHKTLKYLPKKSTVAPRGAPQAKSVVIAEAAQELKFRELKAKSRVNPAPLRVLGRNGDACA